MLLGLLGIPPLVSDPSAPSDSEGGERGEGGEGGDGTDAEVQVMARRRELLALADSLPPGALDATLTRLEAQLGTAVWTSLQPDGRTMLATAEMIGFSIAGRADHSGPILGLCASVELLLFDLVIDPTTAIDPSWRPYCRTLGQALTAVRNALSGNDAPVYDAMRGVLTARGADLAVLAKAVTDLETMNRDYRVPAAHRAVLQRADWTAAWSLLLHGQRALLPTVARALRSSLDPGVEKSWHPDESASPEGRRAHPADTSVRLRLARR